MARASTQTERSQFLPPAAVEFLRRRAIELGGLVLVAAGVALLVTFASYAPTDPSPNVASGGTVRNLLGVPGAYIADVMLRTLGLAAVTFGGMLAVWGWRIASHRGLTRTWVRVALLPFGTLLVATALASLPTAEAWPLREGLGGVLGVVLLHWAAGLPQLIGLPLAYEQVGLVTGIAGGIVVAFVLGFSFREIAMLTRACFRGVRFLAASAIGGVLFLRRTWDARRAAAPQLPRRRDTSGDDADDVTPREPRFRRPAVSAEPPPEVTVRTAEPASIVEPRAPKKQGTPVRTKTSQPDLPLGDGYRLPPRELLAMAPDAGKSLQIDDSALEQNARLLESVLDDFGVRGEIVKVRPGPVVTLYELEPAPGTKASRVIGLADDIARYMSAVSVRVAVVPGRNVIGIELPNVRRETVYLRELLETPAYENSQSGLTLVLGKDIGGGPVAVALERMPHLLIAGTTGSGKSVAINTMILSLLYRLTPEQCRFIMIDPKMLELSVYDDIPHLLAPVVTDPRKAVVALKWVVREMENRYRAMSTFGVRNIGGFNARLEEARKKGEILSRRVQTGFDPDTGKPVFEEQTLDMTPLPFIVVVVDEMADLMLVAGKDVEMAIQRLAQMARAAGIHIIMATQRPSVDVITGTIKANFPTRVSFQVTSKIDSRTILGEGGAEQLLGQGDMLYMAGGGRISRVHGPFVTDNEVEEVVGYLKQQGQPSYIEAVTEDDEAAAGIPGFEGDGGIDEGSDLYQQAVALVAREKKASTSFIQRHLQIGYNRAARIIEQMETEGIVSAANHVGKREVLIGGGGD
ncbi:S-DNA-T family DNA segregation ATPase FtsK/SpoIIIE [Constrictibacter sp. MBR-5]|jgi:S-DNA-T family DNA segregation ATPase FtsK/SpoIIIE|uniref:DNA translocase FtsK n=1 Tax=Constrictibacter sp. MBR-5 TaxID=3156467 RepID=UPI003398B4B3